MYSVPSGITIVASWNPILGAYRSYISAFPSTDYQLAPGQGYWIWCSSSGVLVYNP
jgi:hypothetical protein